MRKIGRLLFDLIGLALALFALVMGIIAVSGHIPTSFKDAMNTTQASWDAKDVLKEAYPKAFWMGVAALALGAIATITAVISIIMVFRKSSHMSWTAFTWVIAWIASILAGYVVYQIWNMDVDHVKHALGLIK